MTIRRLIKAMASTIEAWLVLPTPGAFAPFARPEPVAGNFDAHRSARSFAMAFHRFFSGTAPSEPEARTAGAEPLTLESLFRHYADDVHRIVARLVGPGASDADIEDLTQQVFLAAHRALPSFRGDSKPSTWLYGIASRVVLTHLRGGRRRRRMVERLETELAAPPTVPMDSAEDQFDRREQLRKVWTCLMQISPKKRIVFMLHEIEGLAGKEIAEALEIKEATVWTRLHHARRELVEQMRNLAKEPR